MKSPISSIEPTNLRLDAVVEEGPPTTPPPAMATSCNDDGSSKDDLLACLPMSPVEADRSE